MIRKLNHPSPKKTPILYLHGVTASADGVLLNTNGSIGSTLLDQGYTVYLGNFRGNKYNCFNRLIPNNSKLFWDYSFHESGIIDFPLYIDYVWNRTKLKMIIIGHS